MQGVSQIKVSDDVATIPFTTFGDTRSKPKEEKNCPAEASQQLVHKLCNLKLLPLGGFINSFASKLTEMCNKMGRCYIPNNELCPGEPAPTSAP